MRIMLFTLCVLAVPGCKKDTYEPVYYPDRGSLVEHISGPTFDSLDTARAWVRATAAKRQDEDWDYEIGKNFIEWMGGVDGVGVYEETVR